jgi:hypothetical protein
VSTDARLGVDAAAIHRELRREFGAAGETTAVGVKQRLERALSRTVDRRTVR